MVLKKYENEINKFRNSYNYYFAEIYFMNEILDFVWPKEPHQIILQISFNYNLDLIIT